MGRVHRRRALCTSSRFDVQQITHSVACQMHKRTYRLALHITATHIWHSVRITHIRCKLCRLCLLSHHHFRGVRRADRPNRSKLASHRQPASAKRNGKSCKLNLRRGKKLRWLFTNWRGIDGISTSSSTIDRRVIRTTNWCRSRFLFQSEASEII